MPHTPTTRDTRRTRRVLLGLGLTAAAVLSVSAGVAPASAAPRVSSLTFQVTTRADSDLNVRSVSYKAPGWRSAKCVDMDLTHRGDIHESTVSVPTGAIETQAYNAPGCDWGYMFFGSYGGVVAGVPGKWFVFATRPPMHID